METFVPKEQLDALVYKICEEKGLFSKLRSLKNNIDLYKISRQSIFNSCKRFMGGNWSSVHRVQTSYIVHKVFCSCFGRSMADEMLETQFPSWARADVEKYLEPINELDGIGLQGNTTGITIGNTTGRTSSRDLSKMEIYATMYGMGSIRLADITDFTQNLNKGETHMAANIEVKTFVKGTDAANMSDDQIFSVILSIEQEIVALEKIQSKPETLKNKIKSMLIDIDALVKYVDTRTKK